MSDSTGSGGFDWRPAEEREAQEAAARKTKIKRGAWAFGIVAVVAFSMMWNPPTGSVHSFTNASDYKVSSDKGCTNSGEGCHGDESKYSDFNAYHPNAKCTTCHDYQGVGCIPCHTPSGKECQDCHDGQPDFAPDVMRLTDPYPRGHYRETTHTAMGTDMNAVMLAADNGKAQAACKACHARDLVASHTAVRPVEGSTYGDSIGCGECHNDTGTNGVDQVKANWKQRRCEDCHTADSKSPMHDAKIATASESTGKAACGSTGKGCHNQTDLHALHPDAPADCSGSAATGEPGCHNLSLQSDVPSATACGAGTGKACHPKYVNDDYSHENDDKKHSVSGFSLSGDTTYGSPCGDCHDMAADGMSLITEHGRPTNTIAGASPSTCDACHNNNSATIAAVTKNWPARGGTGACEACHDGGTISARHGDTTVHDGRPLSENNTPNDSACVDNGCHDTIDVVVLHASVGGCTTEGCHQSGGNIYGKNTVSCGGTRDSLACHVGVHDDFGEYHTAGRQQAVATYFDSASGQTVRCLACHQMQIIDEHSRSNSVIAGGQGTICGRCHDAADGTRAVVDGAWSARNTSGACTACHKMSVGVPTSHTRIVPVHVAIELSVTGTPTAGTCVSVGCHPSTDVRVAMKKSGCLVAGCHQATGDIYGSGVLKCGGSGTGSCHTAYATVASHKDHSADLTGTVNGVTYTAAANVGCFGCHYADLSLEHSVALRNGSMSGGGAGNCRICHAGPVAAENGAYASSTAVKNAIANSDRRCVACHSNGSSDSSVTAVASPHSKVATDLAAQPNGSVWSDPLNDWKTALNATTGGGHNTVSASVAGASQNKDFPTISYSTDTTTYNFPLPSNTSSVTAWLRIAPASEGGIEGTETAGLPLKYFPSATTTEGIRASMVTCSDCHVMGDAVGPQGASVKISIDPAYSQTEYANPTPGLYQLDPFNLEGTTTNNPAGYKPVICVKCHLTYARNIVGSSAVRVGGASVHGTHRSRHDTNRADGTTNGPWEVCIDCHVRIPHAWKRPRLLTRTIESSMSPQALAPDLSPYVRPAHNGLKGIILSSVGSNGVQGGSCSAGSCEGTHIHTASQPATQTYWP